MIRPLFGRRTRMVISSLQYRLLFVTLVHFCIIVLVFATVLFLPLALQLRNASLDSSAENLAAANGFLFLHARLWPAVALVLGLLTFHSLVISHRVAGPLYRFRRVLQAVAEGNLSARATIRRNDYLTQEADAINEMIQALAGRVAAIDEHTEAIQTALIDLERVYESGSADSVGESIRALSARVDRLRFQLESFRGHAGGDRIPVAPRPRLTAAVAKDV